MAPEAAQPAFMGKWAVSRALRQATYGVLKQNKDLLWIPFIQATVTVTLTVVFFLLVVAPALAMFHYQPSGDAMTLTQKVLSVAWYILVFFLGVFFQAASIVVISDRLSGAQTSLGQGFSKAFARAHTLFFWSLIGATVGLVLSALSRSKNIGQKSITAIVGAAWAIATYFVLPEIMLGGKSAVEAVPASITDMRKLWGESALSVAGVYVFLLFFFIVFFGSLGLAVYAAAQLRIIPLALFFVGVSVVSFFVYAAITAVLKTILRTVLYLYAHNGTLPPSFTPELIAQAVVHKK